MVELDAVDRLWLSANYLAAGQIALRGDLPILHLDGYKMANPTLLARVPERW